MFILLLVIYMLISIALVGVILLQKSEGGGLGIGGGSGGMSGFMTGRSTANLLTRATAVLAALFMLMSVLLVVMRNHERAPPSIIGTGAPNIPVRPATPPVPTAPAPARPATPATPAAPIAH